LSIGQSGTSALATGTPPAVDILAVRSVLRAAIPAAQHINRMAVLRASELRRPHHHLAIPILKADSGRILLRWRRLRLALSRLLPSIPNLALRSRGLAPLA